MTGADALRNGRGCSVSGGRKGVPAGEVARLYRLGLTMGEIAGIYQVSAWVIASRLDQARVPRRAPGNRAGLPIEKAVCRYRRQPGLLADLAAGLGISPHLIVDRAARPAPGDRGHGTYRADVRAHDVADLYQQGWTVGQIAGKYHTAAATILRRLDTADITRRPKSLPAPFPAAEAARRVLEEGASFAGLGREYGVSAAAVGYRMAARGVLAPVHAPRVLRDVPLADIARLYESGLTLEEIAELHKVSRSVIAARLDAVGVTRRSRGKQLPVIEAATRYRDGDSLAALAARYGTTARTVWGKLTAAGIGLRPPGGRRIAIPINEAVDLYTTGHTITQLAGRYGVCESVIYNRLTEAGAPIRHKTGNFKQVDAGLLAALARQIGLGALP